MGIRKIAAVVGEIDNFTVRGSAAQILREGAGR